MSLTIWKFPLQYTSCKQEIEIPNTHKLLTVQIQNGLPTLWALVDPSTVKVTKEVIMYGTGWDIEETAATVGDYLGTVQDNNGFVWHFFGDKV